MAPTYFRLALLNNDESTKELPYSVWQGVFHGQGGKSDELAAWVTHGDPLTAAQIEQLSQRRTSTGADAENPPHSLLAQVARAHRDRIDGKRPTFTVYAVDNPLHPLLVIRPGNQNKQAPEEYSVRDAEGEVLCSISKGRSPLVLRRAWKITLPVTQERFVGYRGTIPGWLIFAVFLPLWIPLTLVSLVVGIFESGTWDELTWDFPQRTMWRGPGTPFASPALDCRRGKYCADTALIDHRIAYAQAILNATR
ncbi:hypothetical protein ACFY12_00120 [Streptomyces sp. NPDC001339]|uniref:hypothetical protein n=1 Tax=Streptomyces sp. NPDC001339 TaxID=3364563 RepID=UPI0036B50EC1